VRRLNKGIIKIFLSKNIDKYGLVLYNKVVIIKKIITVAKEKHDERFNWLLKKNGKSNGGKALFS
jgi:hypothetical protein